MPELFHAGSPLVSSALFAVGGWLIGALMWLVARRLADHPRARSSRSLIADCAVSAGCSHPVSGRETAACMESARDGGIAGHRVFQNRPQNGVSVSRSVRCFGIPIDSEDV